MPSGVGKRAVQPVSNRKDSARNFCRIVREKTWFSLTHGGYAAANPLRVLLRLLLQADASPSS